MTWTKDDLADACSAWQGGRDTGSSLLRAAARVHTGIDHYFQAGFITDLDDKARNSDNAMARAAVLLEALAESPLRDAAGWADSSQVGPSDFAGRGLVEKPAEDPQIQEHLASGSIAMPLWGVSLDRAIADSYGGESPRWIFQIVGEFPTIPAWLASGIKSEEQELICGGHYKVVDQRQSGSTTTVRLEFDGLITLPAPDAGSASTD